MSTKVIRVPANIPTAFLKEAIQKHLKENDTAEVIDKTLGDSDHYKDDARDEKGRVVRDTIVYADEVDKKGAIKRAKAILSGQSSSAFRVAVDKFKRMEELTKELDKITEELKQEGLREKIHALFGLKYEFETRVVELANTYELVMSKQPKAAETTKWEAVYGDLFKILTPELQAKGEEIVQQYRTIQAPKPPSVKFNVKESVAEDAWTKIKTWFSHFADSIKSWGKSFDGRLEDIKDRANAL